MTQDRMPLSERLAKAGATSRSCARSWYLRRPDSAGWPALIALLFAQETEAAARDPGQAVTDQLRARFPKTSRLMEDAEEVLTHRRFPRAHRSQSHRTNPIGRLDATIKRRTDVVGRFPNEAAICRLVGALRLEQNDERALPRHYLTTGSPGRARRPFSPQPVRRDSLNGNPAVPELITS